MQLNGSDAGLVERKKFYLMISVFLLGAIVAVGVVCWVFGGIPVVRLVVEPVMAVRNPLEVALDNNVSDEAFESVVKRHPDLVAKRQEAGAPILEACAIVGKTNYIRILLANGADADAAVEYLEMVNEREAISLLRQVQAEMNAELNSAVP